MGDIQDTLMDTVLGTLSEKIDPDILRRANTGNIRKKLLKNVTNELFYKLFKDEKLNLGAGFGSVVLKKIKEKDKKIFNRKTGSMEIKHISGKKIVYRPGDTVKELL